MIFLFLVTRKCTERSDRGESERKRSCTEGDSERERHMGRDGGRQDGERGAESHRHQGKERNKTESEVEVTLGSRGWEGRGRRDAEDTKQSYAASKEAALGQRTDRESPQHKTHHRKLALKFSPKPSKGGVCSLRGPPPPQGKQRLPEV